MNTERIEKSDLLTFTGAMFLLFLGLRIAGVIDWPWYWLSAPIWGKAVAGGLAVGVSEAKR